MPYPITLEILKNYEELSRRALVMVAEVLRKNSKARFLFPTGKTPQRFYELLVEGVQKKEMDLSGVKIFMLDEYWGGEDYRHYIEGHLLTRLKENQRPEVFVLNGMAENIDEETLHYERAVLHADIDLAILGTNPKGHIGFNEPGSSFDSRTRLVWLSEKTVHDNRPMMERVQKGGDPYLQALTVGIATILSSKKILVLASGPEKTYPIAQLMNEIPDENIPLTALLWRAKNVIVLVDSDAAAGLNII